MYQPEIESLPLAQLRKLQDTRLKNLVQYLYARVPFYKQQFDQHGISPSRIKTMEDLPSLPFTLKADLRDKYPFGMFAVPMDEVARIHCSSGTTGKPTVVGYTAKDLNTFAEVNARSLYAAGARPGMKLHNAYGYGLFTGGLGLHYGAERLGMAVVPVSGGMTDRQLLLLQDFAPEVICCTPSYAQTLGEEIRHRGISLEALNLKYAVLGAEPWTETIRSEVEKGLGVQASNIYGLSEIIGPGVSQEVVDEKGRGSHVWEDHFFPEIVHPDTGEPMPEGEDGVLVFTTLTKEAMPLLRYWTNDITYLYYDKDSRRSHVKMGPIKGRADDMLIIRGVNLFPTQIEEVLEGQADFAAHYQLLVQREGTMDTVEFRVELEEDLYEKMRIREVNDLDHEAYDHLRQLCKALEKKIKNTIGISIKVSLQNLGSVPRSMGGKLNRVLDLRES